MTVKRYLNNIEVSADELNSCAIPLSNSDFYEIIERVTARVGKDASITQSKRKKNIAI